MKTAAFNESNPSAVPKKAGIPFFMPIKRAKAIIAYIAKDLKRRNLFLFETEKYLICNTN